MGYAYEYAGPAIERMTMEERLTVCNMSIEGGARFGYVNPDATTFEYLRGRPYAPQGAAFDRAVAWWQGMATDPARAFDDVAPARRRGHRAGGDVGHQPGPVGGGRRAHPDPRDGARRPTARPSTRRSSSWASQAGQPIAGAKIDVAFVGSCTNGRLSDLRAAAEVARGRKVAQGVRALIVPGSQEVAQGRRGRGAPRDLPGRRLRVARRPGARCASAMNADKLEGREMCASSCNRNFKGRQGSPTGRTLLMSPAMVAAAAIAGAVADVREMLR